MTNNTLMLEPTLKYLKLTQTGPAPKLEAHFAPRINLFTGDNGLGKTFLLDCAWWALTGQWASGIAAQPNTPRASIEFDHVQSNKIRSAVYVWKNRQWRNPIRAGLTGLFLYAGVDSSFGYSQNFNLQKYRPSDQRIFTNEQIWGGLNAEPETPKAIPKPIIHGIIRDLVDWQKSREGSESYQAFLTFEAVLKLLSPIEFGELKMGEPVELDPIYQQQIPTLKLPYGEIPINQLAAGMRRILALAYFVVWAWRKYKVAAGLYRTEVPSQIVIIIDEIEAHLHPKWQRLILPSLLHLGEAIGINVQIQFLIATHSPFVLASLEPYFDSELDKLFHLNIQADNPTEVTLEEIYFVKHGSIDNWLMSDVFELEQARSIEAEQAIEEAIYLQQHDDERYIRENVQKVSDALVKSLAPRDEFWPRWLYFARQYGAKI